MITLKREYKLILMIVSPIIIDTDYSTYLNHSEGRADSLTRRLMPVGDGGPGRGRRSFRWRGANATKQGVGARYSEIVKRLQERRTLQEQQVMSLVEKEKASMVKRLEQLKAQ